MGSRVTSFRIREETKQKLDILATLTGKTRGELIDEAITLLFDHYAKSGIVSSEDLKKALEDQAKALLKRTSKEEELKELVKEYLRRLVNNYWPSSTLILRDEIMDKAEKFGKLEYIDLVLLAEEIKAIRDRIKESERLFNVRYKTFKNILLLVLGQGDDMILDDYTKYIRISIRKRHDIILEIKKSREEFLKFLNRLMKTIQETLSIEEVKKVMKEEFKEYIEPKQEP